MEVTGAERSHITSPAALDAAGAGYGCACAPWYQPDCPAALACPPPRWCRPQQQDGAAPLVGDVILYLNSSTLQPVDAPFSRNRCAAQPCAVCVRACKPRSASHERPAGRPAAARMVRLALRHPKSRQGACPCPPALQLAPWKPGRRVPGRASAAARAAGARRRLGCRRASVALQLRAAPAATAVW